MQPQKRINGKLYIDYGNAYKSKPMAQSIAKELRADNRGMNVRVLKLDDNMYHIYLSV